VSSSAEAGTPAPAWDRHEVNRWVRYHGEIAYGLTRERTALASALIPVTPYILVAGVECYRRHPEMVQVIERAASPAVLGASGRTIGSQIDTVHLWSLANIYLVGRQVLAGAAMLDWDADVTRTATVLAFWCEAARAFRADGRLQAHDADGIVVPYAARLDEIAVACTPVDDARRALATRLNALLCSYLFLLYFDTRAGYQDTGPYLLPDGRVVLLRAFNKFGPSDFPWSGTVAAALPCSTVLAAFVLDEVEVRITDFGTSVTAPEGYLSRLESFALFDVAPGGAIAPLDDPELTALAAAVRAAQRDLYRLIAGMTRRERIHAGAYVYFSFLRPFAEAAGVVDDLDWTVPRDSLDLFPILELLETTPEIDATPATYYAPIPS
jgi:hypothetical protein